MHNLGQTRSSHQRNHLLQTPDTFVRTALPGSQAATAIVHCTPQIGAAFTQYTVEFEPAGTLGPAVAQRFLYVLEGGLEVHAEGQVHRLAKEGFAYLPAGADHTVVASKRSRAAVIEKRYVPLATAKPGEAIFGQVADVAGQPLMGDEALEVKVLIPDQPGYDFAVNVMTYQAGAALSMVEIHVMEHGLLMLEGGGIYRLGDSWYPVEAGDFIWMAPYCPQWFGAIGKAPAKYLIYKETNRHPLDGA
ncbi:(S)-ureidoglycine aminohydrolase [Edaphobacter aggregans]|uniref:(S)-ureidoglycine aminohydrolase n=1 Tax=Edaphobacter aggregans TaxID=570835 RepID=UPI0005534F29|nr:(S)-ureidoglycine aminohydrolase [Edaphobacter aggregans]